MKREYADKINSNTEARRRTAIIVLAAAPLLFVGNVSCLDTYETTAPRKSVASAKGKKGTTTSAKAAPDVEQKKVAAFTYSPIGKRDPFRSYLEMLSTEEQHKEERQREPTEEYEMDQYRLTGLISGTSQPRAMVEGPDGRAHILRIGSRLGKNGGRVTRISNIAILVVEEFRAPTGERIRVPVTIELPRADIAFRARD